MKYNLMQTLSAFVFMLCIGSFGYAQQNDKDHLITIDIDCDGDNGYNLTSDTHAGGVIQGEPDPVNNSIIEVLAFDVEVTEAPYTFITNDQFVGLFEGPGIKNDVFYPKLAGVGEHTITYTATNNAGCKASKTIIITVNPGPIKPIKATADIGISLERAKIFVDNPEELEMHVQLFTSTGQLLSRHTANHSIYIDTDSNYNGIYVVNVQSEAGVYTRQLYVR